MSVHPHESFQEPLKRKDSPERLVFFTDAVVAIALTLLVLPLTDIVPGLVADHGHSIQAFTEHTWQIRSFLLSFLVIGRQWMSHRRLFAQVIGYTNELFMLNLLWLLTVVVMPFPTQMVGAFGTDKFTCLFYIGTMLANSLCLTALVAKVRGNPELTGDPDAISDSWWIDSVGATVSLAVALPLAAFVPGVSYFAILLLLAPGIAARLSRPGKGVGPTS
jgi:uncharacterized membrane protein